MDFTLQTAVLADKDRINELYAEMQWAIYQKTIRGYEDSYFDRYFCGGEDFIFTAVSEGEIIGYLSVEVHREDPVFLYLDDLSVTASCRKCGVGTALIQRAADYAASLGIFALVLHVEEKNTTARSLYGRLGFEPDAMVGSRIRMIKHL